ncbi:hypothetical protein DES43_113123 [Aquamicrobium defluvii]|uniref:HNH endonuclease n=1 Tax=Aquamicrobium defluvii TaxID=69279 RepID=A0A4R6YET6_9HYPH|nr:hypothetical protein DES43_113123 [Aquamicrobium defluvii]
MVRAICSVEGCDRPALTRGFCTGHYARLRRHGEPGGPLGNSKARHGRLDTPEYRSWVEMRRRCRGRLGKMQYVEKGIKVCDRWLHSFEAFFEDMGPRPEGTTLDRWPNGRGNYEPGNCRWAAPVEQSRNRSSNRMVDCDGEKVPLAEYCSRKGLDYILIRDRVCGLGWTLQRAVSEPVRLTSQTKQRRGFAPVHTEERAV